MTTTAVSPFRFPDRLALIPPQNRNQAFELAYSHDVRIAAEARVSTAPRILLFEKKLTVPKTDAIFLGMPYLRVTQGQPVSAWGRLKVYVDEVLAAEGTLSDCLSGQMSWKHRPASLFDAVAFDARGQALPDERRGIFAAHSTVLMALLEDWSAPEPVGLEAGIAAAYYTTKSGGIPELERRSEY